MKKALLTTFAATAVLGFAGCSTSEKQVEEALLKNPEILFRVIEKNPEKFIETVNNAVRTAQESKGQNREKALEEQLQAELKDPKKPVYDDSRVLVGPKDAKITVVEYADFQCPYCAVGAKNLGEIKDKYKGQVKVVFKHMPLEFHNQAMNAAIAFELVRKDSQEKALKFYKEAYQKPGYLENEALLEKIMKGLGYNWKALKTSKAAAAAKKIIEADMAEFQKLGYSGTPVFIVNGLSLVGAQPAEAFEKAIDLTSKIK